jgi:hypothetical protein
MAPHDPLFKRLLQAFFRDFLELVAPRIATQLDLSSPVFLDKEFPSPGPPEVSRVVDLLARLPLKEDGSKSLLVHVEVEARARKGFGERIRSYYRWIQTRHTGQILSIALFLHGGEAGIREGRIGGDLTGPGLTEFRYLSFGLSRCRAAEYLAKPQPLAWALAALMDRRPWSRAQLKMNILARIAEASLSADDGRVLVNCVETYLQLSPGEAEEIRLLAMPETRRANTMLYRVTWEDKMMGAGARQVVLGLLEDRFGPVPEEVRARLEKIRSVERLTRLAQKAAKVKSLAALRLG